MKNLVTLIMVVAMSLNLHATNGNEMSQQEIADRLALKELVDTFSNLADVKDVEAQLQLFTPDATVNSHAGTRVSTMKGRKEIGDAFASFLDRFETVYHINGQQTVKINGNEATGIAYCQVVLIGDQNGKKIMTTQGVRYNDEYVKVDGKWLIKNRNSYFLWTDRKEM